MCHCTFNIVSVRSGEVYINFLTVKIVKFPAPWVKRSVINPAKYEAYLLQTFPGTDPRI